MASIQIKQAYTMPYDELKEGLDKLAGKLGEQYQLECDWDSDDCMCFSRSGADGKVEIGEEEIDLQVNLGMMMSAFKGTIEREIQTFMDEFIY
ncbi:MAG: polyhydroxyalkanoic acid system family protein [Gammaproteobacteria bacterium]